jgi:hypothetical protein
MSRILEKAPVLLAVDTAKSSGWCLLQGGKYVDSGQCDAFGSVPRELCARAVALNPKAVLVLEKPFGGNLATLTGLGAARGCWLSAWRSATGRKTDVRVVSVLPQVWRSQLFGATASFALQEKLTAQLVSRKTDIGADEAAASCIARWAMRAQPSQRAVVVRDQNTERHCDE